MLHLVMKVVISITEAKKNSKFLFSTRYIGIFDLSENKNSFLIVKSLWPTFSSKNSQT